MKTENSQDKNEDSQNKPDTYTGSILSALEGKTE
jgi:hypothetical protein